MKTADQQGRIAEDLAAQYLKSKGCEIIEKRYRSRFGEIDLIARQQETLVFVEVKYRSSLKNGRPALSVTPAKQRKICLTAQFYLRQSRQSDVPCRFDVVELWQENGKMKVHHYQNAFEEM